MRELLRIPNGDAWKPVWSRDGKYIAFTASRGVGVVKRDGSGLTWIPDVSNPTWLSGRRIAFLTQFEGRRAQAIGVARGDGSGLRIVARTSDVAASRFFPPSASPDGTTMAFSAYGPESLRWPLYVVNVDRGSPPRRIAPSGYDATWAPGGRRLAFYNSNALWTVRLDGSRLRRLWRPSTDFPGLPSWSPDGTRIAFVAERRAGKGVCRLVVMNLRARTFTTVARSVAWGAHGICARRPDWSPDSRRLYYVDLPGS